MVTVENKSKDKHILCLEFARRIANVLMWVPIFFRTQIRIFRPLEKRRSDNTLGTGRCPRAPVRLYRHSLSLHQRPPSPHPPTLTQIFTRDQPISTISELSSGFGVRAPTPVLEVRNTAATRYPLTSVGQFSHSPQCGNGSAKSSTTVPQRIRTSGRRCNFAPWLSRPSVQNFINSTGLWESLFS